MFSSHLDALVDRPESRKVPNYSLDLWLKIVLSILGGLSIVEWHRAFHTRHPLKLHTKPFSQFSQILHHRIK